MGHGPVACVKIEHRETPTVRTPPSRLADILHAQANNFGAVRLAMALAVLVSHAFWLATGQPTEEPVYKLTHHSLGEHAVQVFFFLSGVVVTQSLLRRANLIDFVVARVLRIFPALIVCVLSTALLLGPLATTLPLGLYAVDPRLVAYVVKTVGLATGSAPLPGVFADTPVPGLVNLSLWTLKYEVLCYAALALFGFAYLRLQRHRAILTVALALFAAGIFVGAPKPISAHTAADNLRYFALYFSTGMLAYLVRDRLVLTWLALPPLAALFALSIDTRFAELASALFLGYGTLLVASLPLPRIRRLTNQYDLSFGIYIFACPLQQALLAQHPGTGPAVLTLMTLLMVVPLALLSWTLVERPAMALRPLVVGWISRTSGGHAATAVERTGRAPRRQPRIARYGARPRRSSRCVAISPTRSVAPS